MFVQLRTGTAEIQITNLPIHQLTNSERRKFWRRRESNPRPKVLPRRTLHAYPLPISHARREEAAQNRQAPASVKSRGWTPRRRPTTSLFNGIWPPTTRRGQGRRSQRIRLRERTNYPQLTDVPSDLRVNGARHASYESSPPSKPCRPHKGKVRRTAKNTGTEASIVGPRSGGVKWFSHLGLLGFRCLTQVYSRPHNFNISFGL